MQTKTQVLRPRNSAVEVFRCLLMFAIVLGHSYYHGIFGVDCESPFSKTWWHFVFNTLLIWHVDGFVAISGWFGIRFSWRKFLSLYGQILFYSIVGIIAYLLFAGNPPPLRRLFCVSGGWFGGSYLLLMFIAPLLNVALDSLQEKGNRVLVGTWAVFAIGFFLATPVINRVSAVRPTGFGSHTALTLILVYVTSRVARKVLREKVSPKRLIMTSAIFPIGILCSLVLNIALNAICGNDRLPMPSLSYNDPAVYVFAIALLCMFYWHASGLPVWLLRTCSFLGPSMFGVYLLHDATRIGPLIYSWPETWLFNHTSLHPALIILMCAIFTFFFCITVDLLRRMMVSCMGRYITPVLDSIDKNWERLWGASA